MRILSMMGRGGVATRIATTDSAAGFSAGLLTVSGKNMSAVLIQCEPSQVNAARVTWGGTSPTQGASAVGIYLAPGDVVRIVGEANCATFKHISAVGGSASVLQIVPEY